MARDFDQFGDEATTVSLSTSSFLVVLLFAMSLILTLLVDSILHSDPNETLTPLFTKSEIWESLQLKISIMIFNADDKLLVFPRLRSINRNHVCQHKRATSNQGRKNTQSTCSSSIYGKSRNCFLEDSPRICSSKGGERLQQRTTPTRADNNVDELYGYRNLRLHVGLCDCCWAIHCMNSERSRNAEVSWSGAAVHEACWNDGADVV
ncbi:hypothetical protein V2J09_006232 [Rumex salicifolius]